ncbi:MAG: SDR family NAD(P)-dependent oxidoreductase [Halioglobus sp.]
MTTLHETVEVNRPIGEVFDYVSDLTAKPEWCTTVLTAHKLKPGAIAVGTEFELVSALPVGRVAIRYRVVDLKPNKLIVLAGRSKFFDVREEISLSPSGNRTLLSYRAAFDFKPLLKPFVSLVQSRLQKMGRESVAGLGVALEDNFPVKATSKFNQHADKMVLPGLTLFSRLGYTLGSKHFNPISASVRGKHMVVTGATAGIGYACAKEFARRGAQVTIIARNEGKASATVAELELETGNSDIRYELADLSLMADVDKLIALLLHRGKPIDVLVNNAGALFNPRSLTQEGLEQSHALLLLSPCRLTEGLKPLLMEASAARVINVVSGGMYSQKLDVDALQNNDGEKYSGSVAYAREKRALMVLTQEWAQNWASDGIVVNAMHPGWADTPGVQNALPVFRKLTKYILRSALEGADTIVWLAIATESGKISGKLFLDREVRSTHLLKRTRESERERRQLIDYLTESSMMGA